MTFHSIDFLIFFPIVVVIYLIIPKKVRCIWLLCASYYFYISWNLQYAFLLAFCTLITYISGLLIEQSIEKNQIVLKKIWVSLSIILNLGILFFFKYFYFLISNLTFLSDGINLDIIDGKLDLLLPVGLSFYIFQVVSYVVDVYRGKFKAERNILKYALYVSFFPQLIEGPIERAGNLLSQIKNIETINLWSFERIRNGFLIMLWGLFQKLVIADRASLLVENVINNYQNYGFVEILVAMILFAFQIYCDFCGYTNIALGAAKIMGFELTNNFSQPYLSLNVKNFWKRWHITLTSWFRDYLYIPLGGNKKGKIRQYLNTFIVFGISGLWHGADWSYVLWGLINAVYQIIGDLKNKFFSKMNIRLFDKKSWSSTFRKVFCTFLLIDFSWIFFVCGDIDDSFGLIDQMFVTLQTTDLSQLGIDGGNWTILIIGIILLIIVDIIHEKGKTINEIMGRQEFWFRWLIYILLIWAIIMFGIYGIAYDSSGFMYLKF